MTKVTQLVQEVLGLAEKGIDAQEIKICHVPNAKEKGWPYMTKTPAIISRTLSDRWRSSNR